MEVDTLSLTDLNPADIIATKRGNDLIIKIVETGHQIEIDEQYLSTTAHWGIDRIAFANGTVWDRSQIDANLQVIQNVIRGTDGADTLNGTGENDTFIGGKGNDRLLSGAGSDTFVYAKGDGSDFLDEESGSTVDIDTLSLTDLNPNDIIATKRGNDLIIKIVETGHEIEIDEQYWSTAANWGIERVAFANGTVWNRSQIDANLQVIQNVIRGTDGADTLNGTGGNDTFIGGKGNDRLLSGAGSDTFVYAKGDGSDFLDEESGSTVDIDTLSLTDLNPNDIIATKRGNDLIIKIVETGHEIEIDEQYWSTAANWGIERVAFANGTVWNRSQIDANLQVTQNIIRGTDGADTLNGTGENDTLIGGKDNDRLLSGAGSDTFIYAKGDGSDFLDEESGSTVDVDTLSFVDLNPNDIVATKRGNDLIIKVVETDHEIEVDEQYWSTAANWGIERIAFANGTVWDRSQIDLNLYV